MPSSLRAFEHGSPAVGALSVFYGLGAGMLGVEMSGTDICNVCRKKHRKKTHIFSLQKGDHEKSSKIFSFRAEKVRLLSNFQVILSETGSIFGGSGGA